ncbi:mobilome CxxCx(11)CxxC protein [Photobacterium gaetbulicola]|uniref:mobilome CxxCx(11)CxxC protein n=1 Tax=Photobacterium gaetbulicola TaxID=1295392 RepID=UPI0009DE5977
MPVHLMEMRFYTYGAIKIFERRTTRLQRLRYIITLCGLVSPVLVMLVVFINSQRFIIIATLVIITSIVLLTQLFLCLWSLMSKSDEQYHYAIQALTSSNSILDRLSTLIDSNDTISSRVLSDIRNDYHAQFSGEHAYKISTKEKRYGYRQSLIKFSQACSSCHLKPKDMNPSSCDLCGKF